MGNPKFIFSQISNFGKLGCPARWHLRIVVARLTNPSFTLFHVFTGSLFVWSANAQTVYTCPHTVTLANPWQMPKSCEQHVVPSTPLYNLRFQPSPPPLSHARRALTRSPVNTPSLCQPTHLHAQHALPRSPVQHFGSCV